MITAIILTYNESIHIERCIKSIQGVCDEVIVVDSFSTDDTCSLATSLGGVVYQHKFVNQAQQFNWALENCPIKGEWIWRIDADEYIAPLLGTKVKEQISTCSSDINGIYVNKRIVFMGRPLNHGGWYPAPQIKIIRKGFGASENKWMDEHLIVFSGNTVYVDGDQIDNNLNSLTWWTQKHNNYATREAVNMLMIKYGIEVNVDSVKPKFFGNNAERKRWFKIRYVNSPLFFRPFFNFFFRYVLKGGFLDGKQGFLWYVLQGFWYRFLVDAKIYELKRRFNGDERQIKDYIEANYLNKN